MYMLTGLDTMPLCCRYKFIDVPGGTQCRARWPQESYDSNVLEILTSANGCWLSLGFGEPFITGYYGAHIKLFDIIYSTTDSFPFQE